MLRKYSAIKDIVLAVTYQCNSHCRFCHIWKKKEKSFLPASAYLNLPQSLEHINISGGEPFLRPDLAEIVRNIKLACPRAVMTISTNGLLPRLIEKQMKQILQIEPKINLAVSLDGLSQTHNYLRGVKDAFQKVKQTIQLLKKIGFQNLKISFTLSQANSSQLKKVYQLSQKNKAEFSLTFVHSSHHYFGQNNSLKIEPQINQALVWLKEKELSSFSLKRCLRAYYTEALRHFIQTGQRALPDYAGLKTLFIDPQGFIYPSNVWGLKLGQLTKIKSWPAFLWRIQQIEAIKEQRGPASWMICTARQAMKKHWPSVISWIVWNKIKHCLKQPWGLVFGNKPLTSQ